MPSTSLYNTFGNEIKYTVSYDTLIAYLDNATIKFPLPEASTDILQDLADTKTINPVELDTVTTRLESIGFAPPKAKTMASILIQVAQTEGISPHDYFTPGEQSLKLTVDTYEVMNTLRPSGNKVGLVAPISNSKSRFKSQIQK
jgi:hypothetical protein|tara:strand:+ start:33 stop:464 length:432 start_codon:yes stop_codon:yes gene_type:complete